MIYTYMCLLQILLYMFTSKNWNTLHLILTFKYVTLGIYIIFNRVQKKEDNNALRYEYLTGKYDKVVYKVI